MLKKIVISGFIASALSSALLADSYVYVGASQADMAESSVDVLQVGFGGNKVFENNVMFGTSMYYQQGTFDEGDAIVSAEDTFNGMGIDFQLGYNPLEDLSLYAVAGYQVQALASSTSAGGIGYGAGISYKVFEHMAFALEYKTYDMEIGDNGFMYDYDTLDAQIRVVW